MIRKILEVVAGNHNLTRILLYAAVMLLLAAVDPALAGSDPTLSGSDPWYPGDGWC